MRALSANVLGSQQVQSVKKQPIHLSRKQSNTISVKYIALSENTLSAGVLNTRTVHKEKMTSKLSDLNLQW